MLMAGGETGYLTLLGGNRVPRIPALAVNDWSQVLEAVDNLITGSQKCGTLVLDALSGFEKLCHQHICKRDFRGDWGDKGFLSYHKGYDLSVNDWLGLLARLDELRMKHRVWIVLLSHIQVRPFKNPLGEDFDRYVPDCHAKTWDVTKRWADCVLFGNFFTVTEKKDGRHKGVGGTERVLYTERRDSFDAKNRYGLAPVIDIPNDPTRVWATIKQYITQGATK